MTGLQGATVLVTGGAGTIGSTIVEQLLALEGDQRVAEVRVLDTWSAAAAPTCARSPRILD